MPDFRPSRLRTPDAAGCCRCLCVVAAVGGTTPTGQIFCPLEDAVVAASWLLAERLRRPSGRRIRTGEGRRRPQCCQRIGAVAVAGVTNVVAELPRFVVPAVALPRFFAAVGPLKEGKSLCWLRVCLVVVAAAAVAVEAVAVAVHLFLPPLPPRRPRPC